MARRAARSSRRNHKAQGRRPCSKAHGLGPAIGLALAAPLGGGAALAQAGLLTGGAVELAPITLSSGQPLAAAPYELEAGKYYELPITADGTAEIALAGPDFFRNVWINEIVINDIEVRPLGIDSLEFDDEGTATISFVTIRPGTFTLRIPGTTGTLPTSHLQRQIGTTPARLDAGRACDPRRAVAACCGGHPAPEQPMPRSG